MKTFAEHRGPLNNSSIAPILREDSAARNCAADGWQENPQANKLYGHLLKIVKAGSGSLRFLSQSLRPK